MAGAGVAAVAAAEPFSAAGLPAPSAANATATAKTQPQKINTVLFLINHLFLCMG
jgi:hypothetical protein